MGAPETLLLQFEQGVLLRYLSALQHRISLLVQDHAQQIVRGQQQLMRQSVRLMLARTQADWGLAAPVPVAVTRRSDQHAVLATLVAAQSEALLCHAGCQMDAHHWRQGDWCTRAGTPCVVEPDGPLATHLPRTC